MAEHIFQGGRQGRQGVWLSWVVNGLGIQALGWQTRETRQMAQVVD